MLADGILTLIGQDPSYWLNYNSANEMGPAYFFMIVHPSLFILGGIVWIIGLYWLLLRLKHPFDLMLACILMVGHTWGSSSWITKMMREYGFLVSANRLTILFSWTIEVFYFIVIGILAGYSISQYFQNINSRK